MESLRQIFPNSGRPMEEEVEIPQESKGMEDNKRTTKQVAYDQPQRVK